MYDLETTAPPTRSNQPEFTVSEISGAIKRSMETQFGHVRVRGEISGFKLASSGHAYFNLKDEAALLSAVCWRGSLGKMGFRPEDGLEVIATGKVSTYPGRSSYQLVVERMEPAGAGALMALFEKRKAQMAAEGLFAPERKQLLPFMPKVIGVVTSPTGAVIRDILHRLRDRFPVQVLVWPVLVQGEGAKEQIAAAIKGFNALPENGAVPRPDLLIVARGGGSLEDLWAFNEEIVVRAAADSELPLISAVGHETDTTLIDFVSDVRAPTPTAAAEMAVPVLAEWASTLMDAQRRAHGSLFRLLEERGAALRGLARGLPRPEQVIGQAAQRLDDWAERLQKALPGWIEGKAHLLARYVAGLTPSGLLKEIHLQQRALAGFDERLAAALMRRVERDGQKLDGLTKLLESLNYKSVLKRGFALVRDGSGALVSTSAALANGSEAEIEFADGRRKVTAR